MLQILYFSCMLSFLCLIDCVVEPFVVGGKKGEIENFPHSVYLNIICKMEGEENIPWICGASILNQRITLTAAHCLVGCETMTAITISVGHTNKKYATAHSGTTYIKHNNYRPEESGYDIALIKSKTSFNFDEGVKRVALMMKPPYYEKAQVAGWGASNDYQYYKDSLQYIDQYVLKMKECRRFMKTVPKGTICAIGRTNGSYAARGDSGSALVVRGYIQIGIVSYKMPKLSRSLVVYTDTGYFYDWIKKNSRRLYCA